MLKNNIKLLTWFNFFTDFKFYAPIAIIYFSHVTGSYALGMMVFGIAQLSAAFFEVPTGLFSDFLGRKRTVVLGAVTSAFFVFCYAIGFSPWVLFFGAIIEGVARSFYSGNNDALLYDTLTETGETENYHHYQGRLSGMFQVALGISAAVGGLLAFYSMELVFWLSIIPQLVCIFISLKLVEPKIVKKISGNIYNHFWQAFKLFLTNPKLRLLSIADIWGYAFGEASYQFRSAFVAMVWPLWAVGISQLLSNIGAAIGFFLAGKAISRFGGVKLLFIGNLCSRFIDISAFILSSAISPILMSTTSIAFGVGTTAKSTLMQKEFTHEQRATMGSINSLAGSLFFGVVAFFIGFLADKFNPAQALLIVQVFLLFNIYTNWKLLKHK